MVVTIHHHHHQVGIASHQAVVTTVSTVVVLEVAVAAGVAAVAVQSIIQVPVAVDRGVIDAISIIHHHHHRPLPLPRHLQQRQYLHPVQVRSEVAILRIIPANEGDNR